MCSEGPICTMSLHNIPNALCTCYPSSILMPSLIYLNHFERLFQLHLTNYIHEVLPLINILKLLTTLNLVHCFDHISHAAWL
mmetsp:Transcript_12872/g.40628  ORF Transcript_12872/g.40628 Transcript_12872/m.40628 type:complete len:82 (+) Transcript_12872:336-581(+)